jgi:hypothetical protein
VINTKKPGVSKHLLSFLSMPKERRLLSRSIRWSCDRGRAGTTDRLVRAAVAGGTSRVAAAPAASGHTVLDGLQVAPVVSETNGIEGKDGEGRTDAHHEEVNAGVVAVSIKRITLGTTGSLGLGGQDVSASGRLGGAEDGEGGSGAVGVAEELNGELSLAGEASLRVDGAVERIGVAAPQRRRKKKRRTMKRGASSRILYKACWFDHFHSLRGHADVDHLDTTLGRVRGVQDLELEKVNTKDSAVTSAADGGTSVPVEAAGGLGAVGARRSISPGLDGNTVAVVQRIVGRADRGGVTADVERKSVVQAVSVRVLLARAPAKGGHVPRPLLPVNIVVEDTLIALEALRRGWLRGDRNGDRGTGGGSNESAHRED